MFLEEIEYGNVFIYLEVLKIFSVLNITGSLNMLQSVNFFAVEIE